MQGATRSSGEAKKGLPENLQGEHGPADTAGTLVLD